MIGQTVAPAGGRAWNICGRKAEARHRMGGNRTKDVRILRDLVKQYLDLARQPIQEERRELWSDLLSLRRTRPLVLATYGMWNVWCREVFGEKTLRCEDPLFRAHERNLRMAIFHDPIGDDFILEPWISEEAVKAGAWGRLLGVEQRLTDKPAEGGAGAYMPVIKDWSGMAGLKPVGHRIDEEATARNVARLREAAGDLVEIDVNRGPAWFAFMADVSWNLAMLRGLEQMMIDMYESPKQLHALAALVRDATLAAQDAAEAAGDYGLTSHAIQEMPYSRDLERPRPNARPRRRRDLWCFAAAQEFTLISPKMHDEFLLRYQIPIVSRFGLTAYGCCEDLTLKIAMLRQIPNLRLIAVAPRADVRRSAQEIGADYVISWRPNPADMVCCGFDEARIRRIIREGMQACKGLHVCIHLKDVETVEGDPSRLARWVRIVRSISDEFAP
jgi:hypothetical protein